MELFKIPEAFTNKLRLAIISALVTGEKNFKELQRLTDATSGNLGPVRGGCGDRLPGQRS